MCKAIDPESHADNRMRNRNKDPCDRVSFGHVTCSPATLTTSKTSEI